MHLSVRPACLTTFSLGYQSPGHHTLPVVWRAEKPGRLGWSRSIPNSSFTRPAVLPAGVLGQLQARHGYMSKDPGKHQTSFSEGFWLNWGSALTATTWSKSCMNIISGSYTARHLNDYLARRPFFVLATHDISWSCLEHLQATQIQTASAKLYNVAQLNPGRKAKRV